jgi:hypothetical protein
MPPWRLPKSLAGLAPLAKPVALYALALASGAFALEWLEYQYVTRAFATEIYIVFIALAFTGSAYGGPRLTQDRAPCSSGTGGAKVAR